MLKRIKNHIDEHLPFLNESKLLVAVSGGLDSIVLAHVCHALALDISLAHCNFKLRGSESDADERFVIDFAEQQNLEVFVEYFDTKKYAETEKLSIQMAARKLRYDWFDGLVKHLNYDFILTAHHADDNLETFLINLTRGSGLSGLKGIPEINENIIRPLLPFSREEIETYAKTNNLKWRDDSSNSSDDYLRNRLRHHIIPKFKDIVPELLSNFNNTISNLNDTADIVDESLNAVSKRAISEIDDNHIKFKVSEFIKVNNSRAYLFEMFKEYGFTEWNDVENLLNAQSGKQVISKTHRLIKDREHLILTHRNDEHILEENIVVEDATKSVEALFGTLSFSEGGSVIKNSNTSICVDKDKLKFPLIIRRWQKGDVFYPLGMQGKKKLSKYFKDEKLSLMDKENIWLLTSEDKIVWVIGRRADNRFKVTDNTTNILKIQLTVTSSLVEKS